MNVLFDSREDKVMTKQQRMLDGKSCLNVALTPQKSASDSAKLKKYDHPSLHRRKWSRKEILTMNAETERNYFRLDSGVVKKMRAWSIFLALAPVLGTIFRADSTSGIRSAIPSLRNGDALQLSAGLYRGANNCDILFADLTRVSILGAGVDQTIVDCELASRCWTISNCSQLTIEGIGFKNGQTPFVRDLLRASSQTQQLRETKSEMRRDDLLPTRRRKRVKRRGVGTVIVQLSVDSGGEFFAQTRRHTGARRGRDKTGVEVRTTPSATKNNNVTGGCIFISNSEVIRLVQLSMSSCRGTQGGGLGVLYSTVELESVNISNNGFLTSSSIRTSEVLRGAGVFFSESNVTISNSTFSSNAFNVSLLTTEMQGGGGHFENFGSVIFRGSNIVQGNAVRGSQISEGAVRGGGMFFISGSRVEFNGEIFFIGNSLVGVGAAASALGSGAGFRYVSSVAFVGNFSATKNVLTLSGVLAGGGGLVFEFCPSVIFSSHFNLSSNTLDSLDSVGPCAGGGAYAFYSTLAILRTSVGVMNSNYLRGRFNSLISAGGMQLSDCQVTVEGALELSNNYLFEDASSSTGDGLAVGTPTLWPSDQSCSLQTLIVSQIGILRFEMRKANPTSDWTCGWIIESQKTPQIAFGLFYTRLFSLQIEATDRLCYSASVSVFQGKSSDSPLIGRYCSFQGQQICSVGPCPTYNSTFRVESSSMFVYLERLYPEDTKFKFDLEWRVAASVGSQNGIAGYLPPLSFGSFFASGGAITLVTTVFNGSGVVIRNNMVVSSLLSIGAGIGVIFRSELHLVDPIFENNVVVGQTAGGGAVVSSGQGSMATIVGGFLSGNSAVSRGKCVPYSSQSQSVCPIAIGGAVAIGDLGKGILINSILESNSAVCSSADTFQCRAVGGAVATSGSGSLKIAGASTLIHLSRAVCAVPESPFCALVAGGGVYGDSGTGAISNCIITSNDATGIGGGGGGVYVTGSYALDIQNSKISQNVAREGGGLWATGKSAVNVTGTIFINNSALSIGGAVVATLDAMMKLEDCQILNNTASRASSVLTYTDNNYAQYTLNRVVIQVQDYGTATLMVGPNTLTSVLWRCLFSGTVFGFDHSSEFTSVIFLPCAQGTFTVFPGTSLLPNASCLACPYGGKCVGSTRASNGLRALVGFWGSLDDIGDVRFYLCPPGYCCSDPAGCEYDHCNGGRTDRLCGRCESGSGMRFFSVGCGLDVDCNDGKWAILVMIVIAFVFASFLISRSTSNDSSGMISVVFFFYQVLSLVKGTPWKVATTSKIVDTLQSIFLLSIGDSTDSSSPGICIIPGMTTAKKTGAKILFQSIVVAAILAIFMSHWFLHKKTRFFRNLHVHTHHYVAVFVRFGTICYLTLVLVPLRFLECVAVDGKVVWFWDASVQCYNQTFQKLSFAAIAILSPLPLVLIVTLFRWGPVEEHGWKHSIRHVLTNGVREERRWFIGYSMYRRLLLVVASTMIKELNWRGIATSLLCVLFLIGDLIIRPYRNLWAQYTSIATLLILTTLSLSSLPGLSHQQDGSSAEMDGSEVLEWIQFALAMLPILFFVLVFLPKDRLVARRNKYLKAEEITAEEDEVWRRSECQECVRRMESTGASDFGGCSLHAFC